LARAEDLWTLSDLSTPWCVHVVATLRVATNLTWTAQAIPARMGTPSLLVTRSVPPGGVAVWVE